MRGRHAYGWRLKAAAGKAIRIVDNGQGMGRDDALLAFERHATSKLRSSDDLLSIATLGFRGEGVAVDCVGGASDALETRAPEDAVGTSLEIAGGIYAARGRCGVAGGDDDRGVGFVF